MRIGLVFAVIALVGCPTAPQAASTEAPAASAPNASAAPVTKASSAPSSSASALLAKLDEMQVATVGVIPSASPSSASSSGGAPPNGEVTVGGLDGADAVPGADDAVVAKTRLKFKTCYAKALADDPKTAAKIRLSIVVRANGNVDKLKVLSSNATTSLETCIVGVAGFMKFSKPTSDEATLTFTVVMGPEA